MSIAESEVQHIAEEAARRAIQEFSARAVPPGSMSRDEFKEMIESAVEKRVKELFKSIGLDLGEPAKTANKIISLFNLQQAIGMIVLWGAISIIGATLGGIGWLIVSPWRGKLQ